MLTLEPINMITDPRWDPFVESHPFGQVYHLSAWQQVLENSFRHIKGYCFALTDPESGQIKAGWPVYSVKSILTGNRIVSIPFASICDPLVYSGEHFNQILAAVRNFANQKKIKRIEWTAFYSKKFSNYKNFTPRMRYVTHQLDLQLPSESYYKQLGRSTRYQIKKCKKSDLAIKFDCTDITIFYDLYAATRKRLNLPSQPLLFFKNMVNYLFPKNKAVMAMVYKEKKLVAGLLCFKHGRRFSAEYGGWNRSIDKLSPNYFLFYETIIQAKKEKYKIFDFGRTSVNNKELMAYKGHWKTNKESIVQLRTGTKLATPVHDSESSIAYLVVRKACRYLPDVGYKYLSNFCYQHLG